MIKEENLFVLSRRDAEVFFRALANPPPASSLLRKAARRFADKFDVANQRIDWSPQREKVDYEPGSVRRELWKRVLVVDGRWLGLLARNAPVLQRETLLKV